MMTQIQIRLAETNLETVYADDSGMIWVGLVKDGLDQFNPVTGIFKHYRHVPNDPGSLSIGYSYRNFKGSPGDTLGWYA